MHFRFASWFMIALSSGAAGAQTRTDPSRPVTVSGRVVDSVSGAPLANVNVTLVGTPYGAMTDSLGGFRVAVRRGAFALLVRQIDYRPSTVHGSSTGPDADSIALGSIPLAATPNRLWVDRVPDCKPIRERPDRLARGRFLEWVRETSDSTGRVQLALCRVQIGPEDRY